MNTKPCPARFIQIPFTTSTLKTLTTSTMNQLMIGVNLVIHVDITWDQEVNFRVWLQDMI